MSFLFLSIRKNKVFSEPIYFNTILLNQTNIKKGKQFIPSNYFIGLSVEILEVKFISEKIIYFAFYFTHTFVRKFIKFQFVISVCMFISCCISTDG